MDHKLKICFEDKEIFAIDKPPSIPTLPLKNGISPTLSDLIIQIKPSQKDIPEAGIVHRLDNDTSGLVLVAKKIETYTKLRKEFSGISKNIKKEYITLVVGNTSDNDEITSKIAHHPRKKTKMVVSDNGRPAITKYKTIKRFSNYTLLSIEILTGVRHQIRVHLSSIGYPLVGDKLYQNPKKRDEDKIEINRHFLHLEKLIFNHPTTGKKTIIISKLPTDLLNVIRLLK